MVLLGLLQRPRFNANQSGSYLKPRVKLSDEIKSVFGVNKSIENLINKYLVE